jgi:hypothetical protein
MTRAASQAGGGGEVKRRVGVISILTAGANPEFGIATHTDYWPLITDYFLTEGDEEEEGEGESSRLPQLRLATAPLGH